MARRVTYREAGVHRRRAQIFKTRLSPLARQTYRPGVLSDLGGFAGLFRFSAHRYRDPVLVASTDGVGTKLLVASLADRHDTIGIDLVAMCVNDLVVTGARPLFFLDYFATGRLREKQATAVLSGVVAGCREAGCALIGGETAELPGLYGEDAYDLAGFAVGVVEASNILDGRTIRPGDLLLGLASTGLHSNGYALARKIVFEKLGLVVTDTLPGQDVTVGEALLIPTRIYVHTLLRLLVRYPIKGAAHITGGGLTENLPRILPPRCQAVIHRGAWPIPPLFRLLAREGGISEAEMFRVFNMGIGMVVIVPPSTAKGVLAAAARLGDRAFIVGEVRRGPRRVVYR